MHTPTVLPICAALLLFMLNSAYGTSAQGMLDDQVVFTVSTDTKGNVVIDPEIEDNQDLENTTAATKNDESAKEDTGTALEGTAEDTDAALEDTDTALKDTDTALEDTDAALEDTDTAKPESPPAASKHEKQTSEKSAAPATTPPSRPNIIDSDDAEILNFYRLQNRLTVRQLPENEDWMSIESPDRNTVFFHIADGSEGTEENSDSPGNTFLSRVIENLNDEGNGQNDQTRAFLTAFLNPELIRQYNSMSQQGRVTSYSLRRTRAGSLLHCFLGKCFKGYAGLASSTFEINVPISGGGLTHLYSGNTFSAGGEDQNTVVRHSFQNMPENNYSSIRVTLVIPYSYDAYTRGVTQYCSDGKKSDSQKKDGDGDGDGDDENTKGRSTGKLFSWLMTNTPILNRFTQTTKPKSTEQSPPSSSEGDKKTNKLMLLAGLHKSLTGKQYDTSYPIDDVSLSTIQSEIKVNEWLNTGLKSQLFNPVSRHLNPANQALQPQSIKGF